MAVRSEKGRDGRDASEGMEALWSTADELNRDIGGGGEWVPVRAIRVDESLTPRDDIDEGAVARYRDVLDALPPILVQRDTFTLIDGRHRLEAAVGIADHVRIIEVDCPDTELFEHAVRANRNHGQPLTAKERERAGKRLIRERPSLGNDEIGLIVGVSYSTVRRWRESLDEAPAPPAPKAATPKKVRASLDWIDEAIADFEAGAEATAGEVDPEAIDGHIAQAERFAGYAASAGIWVDGYIKALKERRGEV